MWGVDQKVLLHEMIGETHKTEENHKDHTSDTGKIVLGQNWGAERNDGSTPMCDRDSLGCLSEALQDPLALERDPPQLFGSHGPVWGVKEAARPVGEIPSR